MSGASGLQEEVERGLTFAYRQVMGKLLEREQDGMSLEKMHKLESHVNRMTETLQVTTFRNIAKSLCEIKRDDDELFKLEEPMELPKPPRRQTLKSTEELMAMVELEVKKIATLRTLLHEFEDNKRDYLKDLTVLDRDDEAV